MPMDSWWIFLFIFLFIAYALRYLLSITKSKNLPPGPPSIPIISTLFWLTKNIFDIEPVLRNLRDKHGPILTLRLASSPSIFVFDRHLAHQILIQKGAIFSDRLPGLPATVVNSIISSNRHNISSAPYGPLWSVLRRNLSSEILHPTRIKQFANARKCVVDMLLDKLREQGESHKGVVAVMERFQFAMFCLLVFMCFGIKLDMDEITEIEAVQTSLHGNFFKFNVFAFCPKITKILYRKRWKLLLEIRRKQEEIFIPLIRAGGGDDGENGFSCSYKDSLRELLIPEEGGRPLTEGEIVSLCSEFLGAGTDTTATTLEWIMAEIVKHGEVQEKLLEEIERVVAMDEEIKEEDLTKMSYLKAVVMEGLRRHPPAHLVLPHAVTEDAVIGGYVIPKNASVNFMVAEMGMDEKVWEEPTEFKPERFLEGGGSEELDITGSKEIKMMPFGAGRRICPGLGLAMLHLEYFVANLVREFEWNVVEGEEVDLSERLELNWVMKNHLRARITTRRPIRNMKCTS